MTLAAQLAQVRRSFEQKTPPETIAQKHRATEELGDSGILDRVLKAGQRAPEFALPDTNDVLVSSSDLLRNGPLVVSFFRGKW